MIASLRRLFGFGRSHSQTPSLEAIEAAFAENRTSDAIAMCKTAAQAGDAGAALRLGEVFELGIGVLQDFGQAEQWYRQAAEAGSAEAAARLGDIYLSGRGDWQGGQSGGKSSSILAALSVAPDQAQALHWNSMAASHGLADAQARLGLQYHYGMGVAPDSTRASEHLHAAANQGNAVAQRVLGAICLSGPEVDLAKAAHWFSLAAAQGDAQAKTNLGCLILDKQAPGNDEDGFRLVFDAAQADNLQAMAVVGDLFRLGRGTAKDVSAAESWFRRASVRGHIGATNALGMLLIEDVVPQDFITAAHAFQETAEKGDPVGQWLLGRLYVSGQGVPRDLAKAGMWLERAAAQGRMEATELLAAIRAGNGDSLADAARADAVFAQAAEQGSVDALYHRARIALASDKADTLATVPAMLAEAAERGSAAACLQLGILHAEGKLVEQSFAQAARWYREAALRGSSDAEINLAFLEILGHEPAQGGITGLARMEQLAHGGNQKAMWALINLYREGQYVAADEAAAMHWLQIAAEAGNGVACCMLAAAIDDPTMPHPARPEDVVRWLRTAADAGDFQAASVLGHMAYEGRHTKQDFGEAFRYFHKAAEGGVPFAQAWMGDVLAAGINVNQDIELAKQWYRRAAANGHAGAQMVLAQAG